ncbi:MAG: hypothetical protein F6K16_37225 [Symploca sp. SIO2B6]|nr:hypothetical protein [Symploca sp. SIO2B6]
MPYAFFKHLATAPSLIALTILAAGMAVVMDSGSAIAPHLRQTALSWRSPLYSAFLFSCLLNINNGSLLKLIQIY